MSEKENSDNLDQFLIIDNLPEGGLQVKFVRKINSGNVFDLGKNNNQMF